MEYESLDGYQIAHFDKKSLLREKRVILGMTQKQVADKANILLQQYQKFESGDRNIMTASFQMACKVIEALGMDVSDFYHGNYAFGEKLAEKNGTLCFAKTGRSIHEDVE